MATKPVPQSFQLGALAAQEASIPYIIRRQVFMHPPQPLVPPSTSLAGQTALITGANVGLGLECARQLLQLRLARVILAVRSQARGDAAAALLRAQFPEASVDVWLLDLASYDSVTAFARRCEREFAAGGGLDMAILNAAMQYNDFTTSPATHHEMNLQVNVLSTALLAVLLLPVLRASSQRRRPQQNSPPHRPGRLTIVGSDVMFLLRDKEIPSPTSGRLLARLFDEEAGYSRFGWYVRAKFVLFAWQARLAERVDAADVTVNLVNPGLVKGTELSRDLSSVLLRMAARVSLPIMGRSLEAGAKNYVAAAVALGPESHGSYVSEWAIRAVPAIFYRPEGRDLMDKIYSEVMDELNFVGASDIVSRLKD